MNLTQISKIVKNNAAIPILTTVLIDDNIITGTNLETYIIQKHDFNVIGKGCVNFAKLKTIVDKLKIIETVEFKEDRVFISKGNTTLSLDSTHYHEYPVAPSDFEEIGTFDFDSTFKKAQKYIGKDDLRPMQQAVYIDVENIVATDSNIMFYKKHNSPLTAPINVGKDLFSLNGLYEIAINKGHYIRFKNDDTTYIHRGFETDYLDYKSVLRKEHPILITVDKKEFKESIEVALLAANSYTNAVTLNTETKEITSSDLDEKSEAKIGISVDTVKGEFISIKFNGKTMLNVLSTIDGSQLSIGIEDCTRPMNINNEALICPIV